MNVVDHRRHSGETLDQFVDARLFAEVDHPKGRAVAVVSSGSLYLVHLAVNFRCGVIQASRGVTQFTLDGLVLP